MHLDLSQTFTVEANVGGDRARELQKFLGACRQEAGALLASRDMAAWSKEQMKAAASTPPGPRDYVDLPIAEKSRWRFAPASRGGFEDWPTFDDLFPKWFQGVNPNRGLEGSVIDTDRALLERRMQEYFSDLTFAELQNRHPILCEKRAR